jgi:hypothetical protein
MTHRLAVCFTIALLSFTAVRSASATNLTAFYDTITAVDAGTDASGFQVLTITGIRTGSTTSSTTSFSYNTDKDMAGRCERLAVDAMFNPGVFRFAIGPHIINATTNGTGGCKLILLI